MVWTCTTGEKTLVVSVEMRGQRNEWTSGYSHVDAHAIFSLYSNAT